MNDKIKHLTENGAVFFPAGNTRALELASAALQSMKAAVLPKIMTDAYQAAGGAVLGDACWFGLEDAARPVGYEMPSIVRVNREMSGFSVLRGFTIWGRNQMYSFSANAIGEIWMHDMLTFQRLRKYDDFWTALTDCLMVGKL
ncbi:MAG: hypothetical protein LBL46_04385 [Rickettsiales bacterium]|jgi:hypothetical protein|nr:hypothetical protein [Rickettsiales bacterium]